MLFDGTLLARALNAPISTRIAKQDVTEFVRDSHGHFLRVNQGFPYGARLAPVKALGIIGGIVFKPPEVLRSPTHSMKTRLRRFRIFSIFALAFAFASAAHAQMAPGATPSRRPPGPGATSSGSTVVPTGLGTNGGSIADGVYTNTLYRFSMKVPPGWAVVPPPQASAPATAGAATPQPVANSQLTRTLLVMTENAPLKKKTQRKSLQIVANHLSGDPGPTPAENYIAYAEKKAKEQGLPVEYKGPPESVTIHDHKLSKAILTQTTDGDLLHVDQYVTTQGQALLQFVLISPDEAGLKALEPIIQSLEFKPVLSGTPGSRRAGRKAAAPPPPADPKK
jgi:hypothetical protein